MYSLSIPVVGSVLLFCVFNALLYASVQALNTPKAEGGVGPETATAIHRGLGYLVGASSLLLPLAFILYFGASESWTGASLLLGIWFLTSSMQQSLALALVELLPNVRATAFVGLTGMIGCAYIAIGGLPLAGDRPDAAESASATLSPASPPAPARMTAVELTRFGGHLQIAEKGGVYDAENESAVPAGVSRADG